MAAAPQSQPTPPTIEPTRISRVQAHALIWSAISWVALQVHDKAVQSAKLYQGQVPVAAAPVVMAPKSEPDPEPPGLAITRRIPVMHRDMRTGYFTSD
jgi:hypothetical protein